MEKIYNKQMSPTLVNQERDIDDDNRDDQDDEVEENAYMKTKQNGLVMEELKEKGKQQLGGAFVDSPSRSSLGEDKTENENEYDSSRNKRNRRMSKSLTNNNYFRTQSKNFNYSPDTTDYDSNYGDFEFERESPLRYLAPDYTSIPQYSTLTTATIPSATVDLSGGPINNYARYCTSMPVLEDGLSSGHASDNENNNQVTSTIDIHSLNKRKSYGLSISTIQKQYQDNLVQNQTGIENNRDSNCHNGNRFIVPVNKNALNNNSIESDFKLRSAQSPPSYPNSYYPMGQDNKELLNSSNNILNKFSKGRDPDLDSVYTISE